MTYAPYSIVHESGLEAIFEYGLSFEPDIIATADMIALLRRSELTEQIIEEAICLHIPEMVN